MASEYFDFYAAIAQLRARLVGNKVGDKELNPREAEHLASYFDNLERRAGGLQKAINDLGKWMDDGCPSAEELANTASGKGAE
jgi:hypothetical protein